MDTLVLLSYTHKTEDLQMLFSLIHDGQQVNETKELEF